MRTVRHLALVCFLVVMVVSVIRVFPLQGGADPEGVAEFGWVVAPQSPEARLAAIEGRQRSYFTTDDVVSDEPLEGHYNWHFRIVRSPEEEEEEGVVTSPRIEMLTRHPQGTFYPIQLFVQMPDVRPAPPPYQTSYTWTFPAIQPDEDRTEPVVLYSDLPVTFNPGFVSTRSVTPTTVTTSPTIQTVTVRVTPKETFRGLVVSIATFVSPMSPLSFRIVPSSIRNPPNAQVSLDSTILNWYVQEPSVGTEYSFSADLEVNKTMPIPAPIRSKPMVIVQGVDSETQGIASAPSPSVTLPPDDVLQGTVTCSAGESHFWDYHISYGRQVMHYMDFEIVLLESKDPVVNAAVSATVTIATTTGIAGVGLAVTSPSGILARILPESIRNPLQDHFTGYLEEVVDTLTEEDLKGARAPLITAREILAIFGSIVALTIAFMIAEVGSMEFFYSLFTLGSRVAFTVRSIKGFIEVLGSLWSTISIALITSGLVCITEEGAKKIAALAQGVRAEFRSWRLGYYLLTISSFLFRSPFAAPGRTVFHAARLTERKEGLTNLFGTAGLLVLAGAFFIASGMGYSDIGDLGVTICLMLTFAHMLPIPPLDGKTIFDWSKTAWLVSFIPCLVLYFLSVIV